MPLLRSSAFFLVLICAPAGLADVVINEIFYHAPDDLDKLQFVELHNTGDAAVDLGGWKIGPNLKFEFKPGTKIEANGYLVICRDAALFKKYYGFDADAVFTGSLDPGSDRLEMLDAQGHTIDGVRFKSRAPWPVAPDGMSSSLERICPTSTGNSPFNWAPSPLPKGPPKPSGTPGRQNSVFAAKLPPIIEKPTFHPEFAAPGQEIKVSAPIRTGAEPREVQLLWRIAGTNSETKETATRMSREDGGKYAATIPGQKTGRIVRFRIRVVGADGTERILPHENELAPALSVFVHEPFQPANVPFGFVINVTGFPPPGEMKYGPPSPDPPPRGNGAYVHVDAKSGKPELYDFVNITPRSGGRKIRFQKDHPFGDMTTINLVFEGHDRFVLAEHLAYEVYRKCGNAASRSDFVRLHVDGRPIGYQLLVEQPNKAFLKHNKLATDGNLYKCQWFGQGLVGQHEKKTHIQEGHDDLVKLVTDLNRTSGDEQWNVIKKNFDVEQVINYFAVNMVLSHWDGYFNNYFTYHDVGGTGKWTMYPWDQDKTWGFHDGIRDYQVFTDMPITFGMKGDVPPRAKGFEKFFGGGPVWWRPGGHFSRHLLANPRFRKAFLARTREILETVYTEAAIVPLIDALGERLQGEVEFRAKLYRQHPNEAVEHLKKNMEALKTHLVKRRAFLLEQAEIKSAGKYDRDELK